MTRALSTQDRFERELERIADARDLELTIDREYANVGTYRILDPGSFDPLLSLAFNWSAGAVRLVPPPDHSDVGLGAYWSAHELDAPLRLITRYLDRSRS